jgi:hypothetical protein
MPEMDGLGFALALKLATTQPKLSAATPEMREQWGHAETCSNREGLLNSGTSLHHSEIPCDPTYLTCGGAGYCPRKMVSENLKRDGTLAGSHRESLIKRSRAVPRSSF